jgi:hypothetical protein
MNDYPEEESYIPQIPQEDMLKFLKKIERYQKKMIHYFELEGFIEKTDIPGVYKCTPEGIATMERMYIEEQGFQ